MPNGADDDVVDGLVFLGSGSANLGNLIKQSTHALIVEGRCGRELAFL